MEAASQSNVNQSPSCAVDRVDDTAPAEDAVAQTSPILISVASGKGGVGKTMSCLGIAWFLAKVGYRVTAVDLDFGVGNLHLSAGIGRVDHSLDDYFRGQTRNLNELSISFEDHPRLSIIAAGGRKSSIAQCSHDENKLLLSDLRRLDTDMVLLDIGAGSAQENIDYFLAADRQIAVATADLSAITALISFLKKCQIHNIIQQGAASYPELAAFRNTEYSQVLNLYNDFARRLPESECRRVVQQGLKTFQPEVVLNRVEEGDLAQIDRANKNLMRQLKTKNMILGTIPEDKAITRCRRRGQNFLQKETECGATKALAALASKWHENYTNSLGGQ